MNLWYAAHIVMYVKRKGRAGGKVPVWENIVLVKASSEEEAFTKATHKGREAEGDDGGTFRWGGQPARWVFAGIRKLTLCDDPEKRPGDGTEVSFTEMEVVSEKAVAKLVAGGAMVMIQDRFAEISECDATTAGAK
jgi:hypothetical protein